MVGECPLPSFLQIAPPSRLGLPTGPRADTVFSGVTPLLRPVSSRAFEQQTSLLICPESAVRTIQFSDWMPIESKYLLITHSELATAGDSTGLTVPAHQTKSGATCAWQGRRCSCPTRYTPVLSITADGSTRAYLANCWSVSFRVSEGQLWGIGEDGSREARWS